MIGLVTETYSQIGKVQRAIRLCAVQRSRCASHSVRSTIGRLTTARITWLASITRNRRGLDAYFARRALQAATREVVASVPASADRVAGMGIAAQMAGTVAGLL